MLGYMFTDKGGIRAERGFNNVKHMDINFNKITKYFNCEPKFNGVLPRIKDVVHVINLDDKLNKEKHWVS